MKNKNRHLFFKIILVTIADILFIRIMSLISEYIGIQFSSLAYFICGVLVAVVVFDIYDFVLRKRRERYEALSKADLEELTDAVLLRYDVKEEQDDNKKEGGCI